MVYCFRLTVYAKIESKGVVLHLLAGNLRRVYVTHSK